jgi:electron transfer flavoprotein beta subunit
MTNEWIGGILLVKVKQLADPSLRIRKVVATHLSIFGCPRKRAYSARFMKLLVCISKVPDTTTKISFTDNNTKFNPNSVQYIVNPYDEWYALVRALELKEKHGGTVTVIHVGPAENDAIIRKALAIGADDAVRINTEPAEPYQVAQQIASYVQSNPVDVILAGRETIDYNGSVTAGLIAGILDWPYISLAIHLDIEDNNAVCTTEIEGGKQTEVAPMPVVIGAQKGMAEQRIPNMRGIMAARTKPIVVVEPQPVEARVEAVRFELPPAKGGCKFVTADHAEELIELLHNEAKVI